MVAYITKSDASEGFNEVIDFLNGSYIKHALTINPHIYVSCIKQFWNTVVVKPSNDVTRLQVLVDKKKVVITEATIRDALRLDDAKEVDCLPNEEIFTELACMGYEKPSTKLTFYKAFLSSQWKFLIHTILQSLSAKRTSWNEFSSAMVSAVICLSTSRKFNFSKYIFESLVRNVDSSSKFYMYPKFIQLIIQNQLDNLSTHTTKYTSLALTQKVFANMRRVEKGFSGVETPLFEGMLVGVIEEHGAAEKQVQDDVDDVAAQGADTAVQGDDVHEPSIPSPTPPPQQYQDLPSTSQEALDACAALSRRVEHLEHDKVTQALEITKLKRRVKKLERGNKVKVLKLKRLKKVGTSQRIESSDDNAKKKAEEAKFAGDDQVKGRQAEIYQIDMYHASKVLSMQEDEPEVQEVVDVITTAKLITEVVTAASKSVTAASTTIAAAEPQVPATTITAAPISSHEEKASDRAQARRNMIMYLKNVAGFRLDYFKGMSYDDIRPIFEAKFNSNIEFLLKTKGQLEEEENRAIQSINKTPAQKAAKRRKLNEEVEDLIHHLEIVPDEDDDVYIEATPLARKVLVMDYEIIHLNNKPHYKIIRADGSHQLYVSFLTLLKNFDREDLESLWSIVKGRFSTSKPDNFSDDFLLTTLGEMFERPNGQAQVWKNQRTVPGQAKVKSWKLLESCGVHIITFTTTQLILLVERRYPLSRFTLDQMLNAVRLRVEEQSEMSLELLRFTRQQHQKGQLE
uniref:Xylulose kinase-1 n=1 Tax=Tanacetum cinerariifolium TaxID=118510 RepID=A0A699HP12_TANCI|nr:hypothetical protein [Tanacetum cinerariifolium]